MNKIINWIEKYKFLIIILCLTALARIPSLFEPYWYGDEAIYLTIGQAIKSGIPLYYGIHDNKPPFIYVITALAEGNQFWFKFIALWWVLATIIVFYKFSQKVFDRQKWVILASGLFALLICWPKLEGNIANAELFFLLPTISAMYILWVKPTFKAILVAGVCLGLGSLFKMPAILEAGIWPLVWFFGKDNKWFLKSLILVVGILIPIGFSAGYFGIAGSLKEYLTAAWAQNLPYLSSWKVAGEEKGLFSLTGRLTATAIWIIVILILSKKQEARFRIMGLWAIIGLFATLLSGRPYPHYMLQSAGVLAVSGVLVFAGKKRERGLGIIVMTAFLAAAVLFKFYDYQVVGYYNNFGEWLLGRKSQQRYFEWFNSQVNNNYLIAENIYTDSKPGDRIFVWGDEPVLYALSKRLPVGKYTVKYHIKDFKAEKETLNILKQETPKYIVSFGKEEELPGLDELLENNYRVQNQIGEAVIYRVLF